MAMPAISEASPISRVSAEPGPAVAHARPLGSRPTHSGSPAPVVTLWFQAETPVVELPLKPGRQIEGFTSLPFATIR